MKEIGEIKSNIYKIAAVTDRGQRLNKLISPMYEEKANEMDKLIDALKDFSFEMSEELLSGGGGRLRDSPEFPLEASKTTNCIDFAA